MGVAGWFFHAAKDGGVQYKEILISSIKNLTNQMKNKDVHLCLN